MGVEYLSPQQPATERGACGQGLAPPGQVTPNAIQLETSYWAHIVEHRDLAPADRANSYVAVDRGQAYVDYGDLGVRGIPNFQTFSFLTIFDFVSSTRLPAATRERVRLNGRTSNA